MRFRYRAIDGKGRRQAGLLESDSRAAAREMLASQGFSVLAVRPAPDQAGAAVKEEVLGELAADLARLSRAGVPLAFGLRTLAHGRHGALCQTLEHVAARIESGVSLEAALAGQLGPKARVLAAMAGAGEASGRLEASLDLAARYYASRAEFRRRLISAAAYPLIVLGLTIASLVVFFVVVLPHIDTALADAPELPALTLALLAFGRWLEGWGPMMAIGVLVVMLAVIVLAPVRAWAARKIDAVLLGPAGFGIVLNSMASAFCSTFSVLLSAGLAAPAALAGAARTVASPTLRAEFEAVIPRVRDGEPLAAALADVGRLPDAMIRLARLAETSGRLADCMAEAGDLLDRRARARAEIIGTLAPTLFLLIAGLIIGVVVAAVFLGLGAIADIGIL